VLARSRCSDGLTSAASCRAAISRSRMRCTRAVRTVSSSVDGVRVLPATRRARVVAPSSSPDAGAGKTCVLLDTAVTRNISSSSESLSTNVRLPVGSLAGPREASAERAAPRAVRTSVSRRACDVSPAGRSRSCHEVRIARERSGMPRVGGALTIASPIVASSTLSAR
jgi:hypothetical protein